MIESNVEVSGVLVLCFHIQKRFATKKKKKLETDNKYGLQRFHAVLFSFISDRFTDGQLPEIAKHCRN